MTETKEMKSKTAVFADLHIHSKYSRATSKNLDLENLEKWAKVKGIDLLGTGDFTHQLWLKELKAKLENRDGIFYSKTGFKFILTGEISLVFTQGHGRRVHLVLFAPDFEAVDGINAYLDTKGRRDYDGRPIFSISCEEFVKQMKKISDKIEVIPAHVWTPWFGVLGSESGFDSLKEAFLSQADKVYAIETGMSSDPAMNWKISELNNKAIVSFSDSHSFWPWRLGREATIFSDVKKYDDIIDQIRNNTILGTVETDPGYGKYHWDGHRLCNFSVSPSETKKLNGICPVCKKPLIIGVETRVDKLENQDIKKYPKRKKFYKILPLHELISASVGTGVNTKKVWAVYDPLIKEFGNEFNVLLYADREKLGKFVSSEILELIMLNRDGKIEVKPGYDGVYGVVVIGGKVIQTSEAESEAKKEKVLEIKENSKHDKQKKLF